MRLEVRGISNMKQTFVEVWGKYVDGFDPSKHCQVCLKGRRETELDKPLACLKGLKDPSLDPNVDELSIELSNDYDYFYLCALGHAPRRDTNVHLAVEPRPGSVASVGSLYGVTFTIYDAFAPRIDRLPDRWMGLPPKHATCRNFQFGVQMFGYHPKGGPTHPGDYSLLPGTPSRDLEQQT